MEKVSKESVNYRQATDNERCGNCSMWRKATGVLESRCTLVEGKIRAFDTCDAWEKK